MDLSELEPGGENYEEELELALSALTITEGDMMELWDYLCDTDETCISGWQMLLDDYRDLMSHKMRQEVIQTLRDLFLPEVVELHFDYLLDEGDDLIYEFRDDGVVVVGYNKADDVVLIPEAVDNLPVIGIGSNAFEACQSVRTVILPMSLKFIGSFAFAHCFELLCVSVGVSGEDALRSSVFPPALESIGKMAFAGTHLQDLTFSSDKIALRELCFSHCADLGTVWLPDARTVELENGVFASSGIAHLYMPNAHISRLSDGCFAYCRHLVSVQAASIRGAGEYCFAQCRSLQTLTAARPMEYVGESAFEGCGNAVTDGIFPTLRSALLGYGVDSLAEGVSRFVGDANYYEWTGGEMPDSEEYPNLIREALDCIREFPRKENNGKILLLHTGSWYHDMYNWEMQNQATLWDAREVRENFTEVPAWDPLVPDEESILPVDEGFYVLEASRLMQLCLHELQPKPIPWDWEDLSDVLDARLAGDAVRYQRLTVELFLARYVDYRMGFRGPEEVCLDEDDWLPGWEDNDIGLPPAKCHWLQWDVLFNRLTQYEQLKIAHRQLRSRSE